MDSPIRKIRTKLEARAGNPALFIPANFSARAECLDFLEVEVIDRLEGLQRLEQPGREVDDLLRSAAALKAQLEGIDESLFKQLRQKIASGSLTGAKLREVLVETAGVNSSAASQPDEGYDVLDQLVNGLLLAEPAPEASGPMEAEMIFYQPTPARIVLEMLDQVELHPQDVFFDIGSGLGQVCMLVRLLGGIRVRGIEVEAAYCDYARRCAKRLNLAQVEFINADARAADYSTGSIFFMYSPFKGQMLARVLEMLGLEARKRVIRLYTFGPCTAQVTQESWLERLDGQGEREDRLAVFRSR